MKKQKEHGMVLKLQISCNKKKSRFHSKTTMYTRQLAHIIQRHGLHHHSYADDTQIYTHCINCYTSYCYTCNINEEARSEAAAKIENCISEICTWMKANALKINEEKTECIIFSKNTDEAHMTLLAGTQVVKSQETVKILGVTLDTKMSLDQQISSISRLVHMYIRKIKRIRMYLSDFALKTLIQSTVTVRLDYCNSLYYVRLNIEIYQKITTSSERCCTSHS